MIRVGLVGYSAGKFDENRAARLIELAFDAIDKFFPNNKAFALVSGLTNVGIPALGYKEAVRRDWKTVGIACARAKEYECFPVDEEFIVGEEWGDESDTFLENIDCLVRIGGGEQANYEAHRFKQMYADGFCIEFELERFNDEEN